MALIAHPPRRVRSTFCVHRSSFFPFTPVRADRVAGTTCASLNGICAKRLEDLEAWRLAMDVKRAVSALAHRGPVLRDRRFREDLLASAGAISKNIGEGFGRFRPAEFANKLRIALGELYETDTALIHGFESGYFTHEDVARVRQLIERATKVASRLHTYLDSCARQGLYRAPTECQTSNRAGRLGPRVNGKNDER